MEFFLFALQYIFGPDEMQQKTAAEAAVAADNAAKQEEKQTTTHPAKDTGRWT